MKNFLSGYSNCPNMLEQRMKRIQELTKQIDDALFKSLTNGECDENIRTPSLTKRGICKTKPTQRRNRRPYD